MAFDPNGKVVAILGATGVVGAQMMQCLEERNFPIKELVLLASARSAGKTINFTGQQIVIREATPEAFEGVDIVLGAAGDEQAKELLPEAVKRGCVCVDNSHAFRMDPDVPLVIPEINAEDIKGHNGIISAPFAYQLAVNLIPQIGGFDEVGYTSEEMKMQNEGRKIMHLPELRVNCTCVRVPIMRSHSESITVEFERPLSPDEARAILEDAPGIKVVDNPAELQYPMPLDTSDQDLIYVGRIREDLSADKNTNALTFFCCGDQIRKGAATNAVQIAEYLL